MAPLRDSDHQFEFDFFSPHILFVLCKLGRCIVWRRRIAGRVVNELEDMTQALRSFNVFGMKKLLISLVNRACCDSDNYQVNGDRGGYRELTVWRPE